MPNAAESWGLPVDFAPVRYPISDEAKNAAREILLPGEPVAVMVANDNGSISLIATPQRLLVVREGAAMAGATGLKVRDYPWRGITDLKTQHAAGALKISIGFKSNNNRTVELGRRARLAKDAVDHMMPFEAETGHPAFTAIYEIWQHVMAQPEPEEDAPDDAAIFADML